MKKFLSILLAVLGIASCLSEASAFFIPADVSLKGLESANILAVDSDFRALEQAALLFYSGNSSEAANLAPGVNHVGLLAPHTDVPGRYADTSRYGFVADARGWWAGIAVSGSDSMRESITQVAAANGWLGSPDTSVPPGDAVFGDGDLAVWKLIR